MDLPPLPPLPPLFQTHELQPTRRFDEPQFKIGVLDNRPQNPIIDRVLRKQTVAPAATSIINGHQPTEDPSDSVQSENNNGWEQWKDEPEMQVGIGR